MDQHAAGMYYIACCNWLVDALLCMYRCTGLLQRDLVYNLQLFQQACINTLDYSLSVHVTVLHLGVGMQPYGI